MGTIAGLTQPTAIVGDLVAGATVEAERVRGALESLIERVNRSKFDIADLCYKVKVNGYYAPYTTFQDYYKTLSIKKRTVQYLTKMVECMTQVGISREQYEPLGIAKLREITSLDPNDTWKNPETGIETPMHEFIVGFIENGAGMELEEITQHVRTLKGLTGENDLVFLNICLKRSALDNTVRPALDLAKNWIGSIGKDDEGISRDASDGTALEMVAVEYLNDPKNHVLSEEETNDE
jgi:hypothetical protein